MQRPEPGLISFRDVLPVVNQPAAAVVCDLDLDLDPFTVHSQIALDGSEAGANHQHMASGKGTKDVALTVPRFTVHKFRGQPARRSTEASLEAGMLLRIHHHKRHSAETVMPRAHNPGSEMTAKTSEIGSQGAVPGHPPPLSTIRRASTFCYSLSTAYDNAIAAATAAAMGSDAADCPATAGDGEMSRGSGKSTLHDVSGSSAAISGYPPQIRRDRGDVVANAPCNKPHSARSSSGSVHSFPNAHNRHLQPPLLHMDPVSASAAFGSPYSTQGEGINRRGSFVECGSGHSSGCDSSSSYTLHKLKLTETGAYDSLQEEARVQRDATLAFLRSSSNQSTSFSHRDKERHSLEEERRSKDGMIGGSRGWSGQSRLAVEAATAAATAAAAASAAYFPAMPSPTMDESSSVAPGCSRCILGTSPPLESSWPWKQ